MPTHQLVLGKDLDTGITMVGDGFVDVSSIWVGTDLAGNSRRCIRLGSFVWYD